jgi:hypothetical protein
MGSVADGFHGLAAVAILSRRDAAPLARGSTGSFGKLRTGGPACSPRHGSGQAGPAVATMGCGGQLFLVAWCLCGDSYRGYPGFRLSSVCICRRP